MSKCLQNLVNSKTSPVLTDEKYNSVLQVLKNIDSCKDTNLKYWVQKTKKFQIMDLPGLGIKDALVVPAKENKKSGSNASSAFLRVLPESQIFDVMHEVHYRELNHAGYKKCRDYVSINQIFYIINNVKLFNNSSINQQHFSSSHLNVIFLIYLIKCNLSFIADSEQIQWNNNKVHPGFL